MTLQISKMSDFITIQEDDCHELDGTNANADFAIGPCRIYSIKAFNQDTTKNYLKLFDNEAPVHGTTEPDYSFPIPAGDGTEWGYLLMDALDEPLVFATGLSLRASGGAGRTVGVAPGVNEVLVILKVKEGIS